MSEGQGRLMTDEEMIMQTHDLISKMAVCAMRDFSLTNADLLRAEIPL